MITFNDESEIYWLIKIVDVGNTIQKITKTTKTNKTI